MNDALNPRALRGMEEHSGALDRAREARPPSVEANPEGVIERAHSLETASECDGIIEPISRRLDLALQLVRTIEVIGQCPDVTAGVEQSLGDRGPGVAEGSRDEIGGWG